MTPYEVAHLIHRARLTEGAKPIGRKIGFTDPGMWARFGVCEPIWAHIYDTTVVHLHYSQDAANKLPERGNPWPLQIFVKR